MNNLDKIKVFVKSFLFADDLEIIVKGKIWIGSLNGAVKYIHKSQFIVGLR